MRSIFKQSERMPLLIKIGRQAKSSYGALSIVLSKSKDQTEWSPQEEYAYREMTFCCIPRSVRYKLDHRLVKLESRDVTTYAVLDTKSLSEGGFGQVLSVLKTLSFNGQQVKPFEVNLVLKLQLYETYKSICENEFHWVAQIPHLKAPQNTVHFKHTDSDGHVYSAIFMQKIDGHRLSFYRIAHPLKKLAISVAILESYIDQVYQYDIAHRDIKLHNILVVRHEEDAYKVYFVDYGFAVPFGEYYKENCGTNDYIPPESMNNRALVSDKHDCFSLGITLKRFWLMTEVNGEHFPYRTYVREYIQHQSHFSLKQFEAICSLCIDMADKNPEKRVSPQAALKRLKEIRGWSSAQRLLRNMRRGSLERKSNRDIPGIPDGRSSQAYHEERCGQYPFFVYRQSQRSQSKRIDPEGPQRAFRVQ